LDGEFAEELLILDIRRALCPLETFSRLSSKLVSDRHRASNALWPPWFH
jgi:hypothetical protein